MYCIDNDANCWSVICKIFVEQDDGVNCGPIALLKLIDHYNPTLIGRTQKLNVHNYRPIVMTYYEKLLKDMDSDLLVPTKQLKHKQISNETVVCFGECAICLNELQENQDIFDIECCNKSVHESCYVYKLSDIDDNQSPNDQCPLCYEKNITVNEKVSPQKPKVTTKPASNDQSSANTGFNEQVPPQKPKVTSTPSSNDQSSANTETLEVESQTTETSVESRRNAAMKKKRKHQLSQALKMMKRHCKDKGVALGAVVNIRNDPRDVTQPRGTIGAVFAMKDTGGIQVCTQYGVLVG